jgi:hypothetical protein
MRHLVLALLIALLPIRGWIGEVMATGMASSRVAHSALAIENGATHVDRERAAGHFSHEVAPSESAAAMPDCPGHGDAPVPASHVSCDSCQACQACHTVGLSPPLTSPVPLLTPLAPPHSAVARFASADMAPGQKPPIS